MKIVLNKQEVKSFKEFLVEYARACRTSINNFEGADMQEEIANLSDEEMVRVMLSDMNLTPDNNIVRELEDGGYEIDLPAQAIVAFNNYMSKSMVTLTPVCVKLTGILVRHMDSIKSVVARFNSGMSNMTISVINRVLKGAFTMIGLESLYIDLFNLYTEFTVENLSDMKMHLKELEETVAETVTELNQ